MNRAALITYLIAQSIVIGFTVYFFWKVLKKPNNK